MLTDTVPGLTKQRWSPQVVRDHAVDGTWYLATQLMLHPIPLDPIPRCITDARLPVAAVMYDVIPFRYPDVYFTDPNALRQAELRAPLARTVDTMLAISDFVGNHGSRGAGVPARADRHDRRRGRASLPTGDRRSPFAPRSGAAEPCWALRRHRCRQRRPQEHRRPAASLGARRSRHGRRHPPGRRRRSHPRCAASAGRHGPSDSRCGRHGSCSPARSTTTSWSRCSKAAALAVMPSLEEGFGLPVLEAAACGVPTIASNVSSLPEVLDEPAACFDPHDPQAIAAAIVTALTDEEHRSVLLAAGRRAVERWTWSNAASATVEALETMGPRWPQRTRRSASRLAVAGRVRRQGRRRVSG